ncbi:MAG: hypothetical protein NTY38_25350 [Acidobacteria bacterium]|nr:hypothetical protein [Acidobacteriota bacterium]
MNEQQFLLECGKSYPDAMAALGYFRQLVQRQCEAVVRKRTQELCEVLGISSQDLKLQEHASPDKLSPAVQDVVELGWKARRAENLWLRFYLYWQREPDEGSEPLGVGICVWIRDRNKLKALGAKLDQHVEDPRFGVEPWDYVSDMFFSLDMKEAELPQVDEKLDELFGYTIRFLKSLDGIASYFQEDVAP